LIAGCDLTAGWGKTVAAGKYIALPPAAMASIVVAMTALPNAAATTTIAILCNVDLLMTAISVPDDSTSLVKAGTVAH